MKRSVISIAAVLAFVLLAGAGETERYIATVLVPDTVRTGTSGATAQLDIAITSYTSDQEMDDLGAILGDGNNQSALLKKIEGMKRVGWISRPGHTGIDIKIIRSRKTANGREITMLTDRPISFWEAMNSPVTRDYPYGMLRFTIDDKGNGQGDLNLIVKVKKIGADGITVDDYGAIPWPITSVKSTK